MKRIKFSDTIIYEDSDYLVLNKLPGISTLSDRADDKCILDWARKHHPEIQVCHRLDKDTSGVLALAKHPEAYRALSLQFQNRLVIKKYHAVVQGRHQFKKEKVKLPLTTGRRGLVHVTADGKNSETILDSLDIYKAHTLVDCQPITGRTHQIRVHLSYLGAPIVADLNYGGQKFYLSQIKHPYNLKRDSVEQPLMSRLALHAYTLEFQLLDKSTKLFQAVYPKDFKVLINQLDKNRLVDSPSSLS